MVVDEAIGAVGTGSPCFLFEVMSLTVALINQVSVISF